jgi:hypothetical protein
MAMDRGRKQSPRRLKQHSGENPMGVQALFLRSTVGFVTDVQRATDADSRQSAAIQITMPKKS